MGEQEMKWQTSIHPSKIGRVFPLEDAFNWGTGSLIFPRFENCWWCRVSHIVWLASTEVHSNVIPNESLRSVKLLPLEAHFIITNYLPLFSVIGNLQSRSLYGKDLRSKWAGIFSCSRDRLIHHSILIIPIWHSIMLWYWLRKIGGF